MHHPASAVMFAFLLLREEISCFNSTRIISINKSIFAQWIREEMHNTVAVPSGAFSASSSTSNDNSKNFLLVTIKSAT